MAMIVFTRPAGRDGSAFSVGAVVGVLGGLTGLGAQNSETELTRATLGFSAGLAIAAVSSLLGVTGGELIIPTLVLLFGLDIKMAGSVSLNVSIPTILVGLARYRMRPICHEVRGEVRQFTFMAMGLVLGVWIGALLMPHAPGLWLKAFLGILLLVSAAKMARMRVTRDGV